MATDFYWNPRALAVAQLDTLTPANVEVGDIFEIVVNNIVMASYTAAVATVADVTAGLVDAWNLQEHPYAKYITASDLTTSMTLTADVAGWPFNVFATAVNGGATDNQTLVIVHTTVATGPNFADNDDNWIDETGDSRAPISGSDYYFLNSSIGCCFNFGSLSALTNVNCHIEQSFTGMLGLNPDGFAYSSDGISVDLNAPEYRPTRFSSGVSGTTYVGARSGPTAQYGSGRIRLTVRGDIIVYDTASVGIDAGRSPLNLYFPWGGTPNCYILGGSSIEIGSRQSGPGAGAIIANLIVEPSATNVEVFLDSSSDVTLFRQNAGLVHFDTTTAALTMELNGGTCNTSGVFNVDSIVVNGGVANIGHSNGASPIIDLLTQNGGEVDTTVDSVAKTITTFTQLGGKYTGSNHVAITNTTKPSHNKYTVEVLQVS